MGYRDLKSNVIPTQSLAVTDRTAAASGTAVDTRGYDSAMFVLETGALSDGVWTFVPQESDTTTDGDFGAVDAGDLDGTLPTVSGNTSPVTGANALTRISYKGSKRYLRVRVTVASAPSPTVGAVIGGHILLGHPHQAAIA